MPGFIRVSDSEMDEILPHFVWMLPLNSSSDSFSSAQQRSVAVSPSALSFGSTSPPRSDIKVRFPCSYCSTEFRFSHVDRQQTFNWSISFSSCCKLCCKFSFCCLIWSNSLSSWQFSFAFCSFCPCRDTSHRVRYQTSIPDQLFSLLCKSDNRQTFKLAASCCLFSRALFKVSFSSMNWFNAFCSSAFSCTLCSTCSWVQQTH